jgi:hypothetical protein
MRSSTERTPHVSVWERIAEFSGWSEYIRGPMKPARRVILTFTLGFQYFILVLAGLGIVGLLIISNPIWIRLLGVTFWGLIGAVCLGNLRGLREARKRAGGE